MLLAGLTLLTYNSSAHLFTGQALVVVLLAIATIKVMGIAWQFMELAKAHPFWKWSIALGMLFFSLLVWAFI